MCGELVQFDKVSQSRIYEFGKRMNSGHHADRIKAEGELIKFVRDLATTIEGRKVTPPVEIAAGAVGSNGA